MGPLRRLDAVRAGRAWLLEQFEFPFKVVYAPDLDHGGLREKFDVLVFVDGAIPGRGGAGGSAPKRWRGRRDRRATSAIIPQAFRGQSGNVTVDNTVPHLKKFLEAGGTILTIGSSTNLATHRSACRSATTS